MTKYIFTVLCLFLSSNALASEWVQYGHGGISTVTSSSVSYTYQQPIVPVYPVVPIQPVLVYQPVPVYTYQYFTTERRGLFCTHTQTRQIPVSYWSYQPTLVWSTYR
jgi:hypothetical protein